MENQDILQAMFEEATVGIIVVDETGKIRNLNPYLAKLFGYQKEELVGQQLEILMPHAYRSIHVHHRQDYHQHPVPRPAGEGVELYGQRKNEEVFPVEISLNHIVSNHERLAIAYVNDVSYKRNTLLDLNEKYSELNETRRALAVLNKKLEQKVKKRTNDLERSQQQLQSSLEKERELGVLKSRFVSMASHEFRTPLSSILSSASLIEAYQEGNQQDKREKHTRRIKNAVKNLTNILNDFLSLEKLESGKLRLDPHDVNFEEYIQEIIEEINSIAKESQLIRFQHNGNKKVCIDSHLVKNILINLLSNAIKYSPKGEDVEIISHYKGGWLHIDVKDNGIGIPETDKKHMFTRFYRATNVENIMGTGLGLTIVKRYLDLMGGEIEFESEQNNGTTFKVKIPQE